MKASQIAMLVGGLLEGRGDLEVDDVAPLESASCRDATFVAKASMRRLLERSQAGCVLVPRDMPNPGERTVVRVADPRRAFGELCRLLRPRAPRPPGVHATAVVDPAARLGRGVSIGPFCLVESGAILGDDVVLEARVTVHDGVRIGARTVVKAGAVLGGDGFGFAPAGDRYEKLPQVGGLDIGADVVIGANTTIDRGALAATRIGDGCKIDNLVHVAHNCVVGRHVVIAAQTGLAGGAVVEDWVVLGGQVGVGDKVRIGARARIGAAAAIPTGKFVPAGEAMWGVPARPLRQHLRTLASLGRIEALRDQVRELSRRQADEAQLASTFRVDDVRR